MDNRTQPGAHLPEDGGDATGSTSRAVSRRATRRWAVTTTDGPQGRRIHHHAGTLDAAMVQGAIMLGRRGDSTVTEAVIERLPTSTDLDAGTARKVRRISYLNRGRP